MKTATYIALTFVFLVVLTSHYTPLVDPVAAGDGAHYRAMAMGEQVPQPFFDRIALSYIIGLLAEHVDISSRLYVIENVDAWFFVVTFLCLWLTSILVRASLMRFGRREASSSLAGCLYLATFWLTGYQLSNFWLQDPFINLCVWVGIYLWSWRWYYGVLGLILAVLVKGGTLGFNWAVISTACSFYEDIPQLLFSFGFLWITIGLVDRRLLAVLAIVFIVGRMMTADVARACVAVLSFPVLLGVSAWVDERRVGSVGMMIVFLVHVYQQSTWLFCR